MLTGTAGEGRYVNHAITECERMSPLDVRVNGANRPVPQLIDETYPSRSIGKIFSRLINNYMHTITRIITTLSLSNMAKMTSEEIRSVRAFDVT